MERKAEAAPSLGDSPAVTMKSMMAQILRELDSLRTQQEVLMKELTERQKQEDDHRTW